jgi:hypothetical protein
MPNSCSMEVVPMKFCVIIWEGFTVKISITPWAPACPEAGSGELIEIHRFTRRRPVVFPLSSP